MRRPQCVALMRTHDNYKRPSSSGIGSRCKEPALPGDDVCWVHRQIIAREGPQPRAVAGAGHRLAADGKYYPVDAEHPLRFAR